MTHTGYLPHAFCVSKINKEKIVVLIKATSNRVRVIDSNDRNDNNERNIGFVLTDEDNKVSFSADEMTVVPRDRNDNAIGGSRDF